MVRAVFVLVISTNLPQIQATTPRDIALAPQLFDLANDG